MMKLNTLMDAVKETVERGFPGVPVYTDYLPKDFKRPSFALECRKEETADLNIALVKRTVTVALTCLEAVNDYGDSSREALNGRMDALEDLFARGYLQVEDRAVQVQTNRGTGNPEFAEVQAVLSWSDQRPGWHDPEDPDDPVSAGVPLMEDYQLTVTTKE